MGIEVRLTAIEVTMAAVVGAGRHMEAVESGRRDRHDYPPGRDGLADHILGACGEAAVGKLLGRWWGGDVCAFKKADIGSQVQVKTRSNPDWDLIVRRDDNPDHIYILVTGVAPDFVVHGWIKGRDAMENRCWIREYGGREAAWFVPKSALTPFFDQSPARPS